MIGCRGQYLTDSLSIPILNQLVPEGIPLEDGAHGVLDVRTQEVQGSLESFLRVRSMKSQTHDKKWHRIILNNDLTVGLE